MKNTAPMYSIVIPTYNHLEDCLKPCLESIIKHTDLSEVEIVVVANGCTDGTLAYLQDLGQSIFKTPGSSLKIVWLKDASGYTKSTNAGIQSSTGKYVVLLNNDNVILEFGEKSGWLRTLREPFLNDSQVGITGVAKDFHPGTRSSFLLFFCVMLSSEVIEKAGLLDEIFNPGYGEDIDYCYRLNNMGYKVLQVPDDISLTAPRVKHEINFPLWHKSSITVHEVPGWEDIVTRNEKILKERYVLKKDIKLNMDSSIKMGSEYVSVQDPFALSVAPGTIGEIHAHSVLDRVEPEKINGVIDLWSAMLKSDGVIVADVNSRSRVILAKSGYCNGLFKGSGYRSTLVDNRIKGRSESDIKKFVLDAGMNDTQSFGGTKQGGYCLLQNADEISRFICDYKDMKIGNYLEIGVADAGTMRLLCDFNDIENVFSIDLGLQDPRYPHAYRENVDNLKNRGTYNIFRGDSHSAEADKWLSQFGQVFDFVFIDGDHTYDGVIRDTLLAMRYAKPGCLFVFHDHACVPEINKLYHEMIQDKFPTLSFEKEYAANDDTKKGISVFRYRKNEAQIPAPTYSIVIPTYNHLDDCLKPCLESIIKNTDLSDKEVIVVANGCTDGTRAYVESLGKSFKLIWMDEAAGYIRPTNAGIKAARGKYIILLNNDAVVLEYSGKDGWIKMLAKPFMENAAVGITGPLKIDHPPTGIVYMHFFCAMIKRAVFDSIGLLDEDFGYGYSEDADFCARATKSGFLLKQVPTEDPYTSGSQFPIWHNGSVTFNDCPKFKPIDFSNEKRLVEKYGSVHAVKDNTIHVGDILEQSTPDKVHAIMDEWLKMIASGSRIVATLNDRTTATIASSGHPIGLSHGIGSRKNAVLKRTPISDIKEAVLAAGSRDLEIFGGSWVGGYNLQQDPDELSSLLSDLSHMNVQNYLEIGVADSGVTRIMCDVLNIQNVFTMDLGWMTGEFPTAYRDNIENLRNSGTISIFRGDSHSAEADRWLKETGKKFDLIFIDGDHSYEGAVQDTVLAMKYAQPGCVFAFHDHAGVEGVTRLFNDMVQKKFPDLTFVKEYVSDGPTKKGLSVFRYKQEEVSLPKYSIVIPTFNHLDDCLKPCIESIRSVTDLSQVEVIVVANGCQDGTRAYVESLGSSFKLVWFDEQLGYIKATNAGIRAARGEYVVLLNNDVVLLPQPKNYWTDAMVAPFSDPKAGIVGPRKSWREDIRNEYMLFFCVMMRKSLFSEIGLLDEDFGIGYHEDTDFSIRTKKAGYRLIQVPTDVSFDTEHTDPPANIEGFPIYHPGGKTFFPIYGDSPERLGRGMSLLIKKHGISVSIVIPTFNHLDDCLKPCLESIIKNTDLSDKEVIVVANGCTDGTRAYVESLGKSFKLIWMDEAAGYPKATNAGIKAANGAYVVLLNNDAIILPPVKTDWISLLKEPFEKNKSIGASGPLEVKDQYIGGSVLMFFCVMVKREVFDAVGYLDESFSPGGCEDIDFIKRMEEKGFTWAQVPYQESIHKNDNMSVGGFPIYHFGSATFSEIPEYRKEIVRRNGLRIMKKYNKNIRLFLDWRKNTGKDCVTVGSKEESSDIIMNPLSLDLEEGMVSEIHAFDLLDRVDASQKQSVMNGWLTALKPGGKLFLDSKSSGKQEIVKSSGPSVSIIIPTFNHLDDCLKPCIENLIQNTDLDDKEVIIVANGCTDGTRAYVESLGKPFRLIWHDEALGYSKPLNIGIQASRGKHIILMNNDAILLPYPKNCWIEMLKAPFLEDPKMGITGPLSLLDRNSGHQFLLSFCIMISRDVFDTIGYLDESYGMGGGEDVDFLIRAENAGFHWRQVPNTNTTKIGMSTGGHFPMYHGGGASIGDLDAIAKEKELPDRNSLSNRNMLRNMRKYNKNIRLTFNLQEDLSNNRDCPLTVHDVDVGNVAILMDPLNLDFDTNSVMEIHAGNKLETIDASKAEHALENWMRVLAKGGSLYLDSSLGKFAVTKIDATPLHQPLPDGWFSDEDISTYRSIVSGLPQGGRMVEIGVWQGRSMCSVADLIKEKGLIATAVDTFRGTEDNQGSELARMASRMDVKSVFCSNIERFGISGQVSVRQMASVDAAAKFEDKSLDCIFIDADHSYVAVMADIKAWLPKLKDGGIICGHDYATYSLDAMEVMRAVNEVFAPHVKSGGAVWYWSQSKRGKVYDCFPFCNELDLLEIRLNELDSVVDKFVLCEMPVTHSGKPKPLYFDMNKDRFRKFLHKIDHIIATDWPTGEDPWEREMYQRSCLARGLTKCKDEDIIICSDADEIPSRTAVYSYQTNMGPMKLSQRLYSYRLNLLSSLEWIHPSIFTFGDLRGKNFQDMRFGPFPVLPNGGWHFTSIGKAEDIISKFESFAHQEYNQPKYKDPIAIKEAIESGKDIMERNFMSLSYVDIDASFPSYVVENKQTFVDKGLIKQKDKPRVYDCFPFFNELDLLEIRLNELDPYVDVFVLSEMPVTHSGKPKPLHFAENKERFKKFLPKIRHIVADKYPDHPDPWHREHHQRDRLIDGLYDCKDDDVIILSDLDEIPRGSKIQEYRAGQGIRYFEQSLYNFFLNLSCGADKLESGVFSRIVSYGEFRKTNMAMTGIRYAHCSESDKIENGGWHFRWTGGAKNIVDKLESWAHQEWNVPKYKDVSQIEAAIIDGVDFFERNMYEFKFVEVDSSFPKFLVENQDKFKGLIRDHNKHSSKVLTMT